jgi:hypothetical protein
LGFCHGGPEVFAAAEQFAIELFDFEPVGGVDAGAAHPDDVQPAHLIHRFGDGERRQILGHAGEPLHHRQRADADELVYGGVAGEEGAIKNRHVAREQNSVRQDDVIVDVGVVADVHIRHQQVVRTDDRFALGLGGAMHGDVFAEDVVVADADAGGGAVVFQILRGIADDAARMKAVARAHGQQAGEINMGTDDAARAEFHAGVNDCIRPDLHGRIELCFAEK